MGSSCPTPAHRSPSCGLVLSYTCTPQPILWAGVDPERWVGTCQDCPPPIPGHPLYSHLPHPPALSSLRPPTTDAPSAAGHPSSHPPLPHPLLQPSKFYSLPALLQLPQSSQHSSTHSALPAPLPSHLNPPASVPTQANVATASSRSPAQPPGSTTLQAAVLPPKNPRPPTPQPPITTHSSSC